MAPRKAAPPAPEKFEYVVKADGWLNGTYRKDGEVVKMSEAAAEVFVRAYRLSRKPKDDKAAKPAAEPASASEAPAATVAAPEAAEPASDHASAAAEPAAEHDEHAAS